MTPLTGEALEKRIAELEQERDELLRTTEFVRYGPCRTTSHGNIKRNYNRRIGCLRSLGVEFPARNKDCVAKQQQTNLARHGCKAGNVEKRRQTNLERYGSTWGDQERCQQGKERKWGKRGIGNTQKAFDTKLRKYGNKCCDVEKRKQTVVKRYGNAWGNIDAALQTKQQRYGNKSGNLERVQEVNMERHGVPWFCMTTKCRDAQGHVKSRANHWWHDKLLQELGIDCGLDNVNLGRWSYDLDYCNEHCKLLIEVNPLWSHNATYGFAYLTGRTKHNKPVGKFYHFDKTQLALKHGYTCITIFEWMDDNEVIDVIRKHLAGKQVDSADFALNPQLSDDKSTIHKHWCHLKTKEHVEDCGQDEQEMINAGYVAVYDCGHAR